MKIVPLKQLAFNTTNIPDDTTPQWNQEVGYSKDTIRQLNNKLYKNYATINPLCDYIHDDSDILRPNYVTTVDGVAVADNTAVECVLDETVVYNKDNNTYYLFDNHSGCTLVSGDTYLVNFTTQDHASPVNFTTIDNYRHDIYNPETTPLIWEDLGYTNKYKMLDQSLGSQTVFDGDMEMSFLTTKVDSIYLINVLAEKVDIIVTELSGNTEVYNETITLVDKNSLSTWYGYFFNEFTFKTKINEDLPIGYEIRIDIKIYGIGGVSKCGLVGVGRGQYIGGTLYGANIGIIDYSTKETNSAGEDYFQFGNYKSTNNITIDVPSGSTDSVCRLLNDYRATPVIFEGSDIYQQTIIFGIYNKYDMLISTPSISKLSLDLQSLI